MSLSQFYIIYLNTAIEYIEQNYNQPLSIDEIAWEVGFNSSANFIKTFHKKVSITPKMFRKLNS